METSFQSDAGGLWAEQQAGSTLDYTLDWSDRLDTGDSIASSEWLADTGLIADRDSNTNSTSTVWLSGGVGGRWYRVSNTVTTGAGRVHIRGFRVFVVGKPELGIVSVFPDLGATVAALRRDRLVAIARTYAPDVPFSDEYLVEKLVVAERDIETALRVFLTPREVVPDPISDEDLAHIAALEAAGERVHIEPGYDYDPTLFRAAWGPITLRHPPIVKLHSIAFHYPQNLNAIYDVDLKWVRADRRVGRVQFVPFGAFMAGQLGGFVATSIGIGAAMPLMIRIRYRSGLENVARDWPQILSAIKSKAVLGIVDDLFLPKGGSVSGDGLSQSFSFDVNQHRSGLDDRLERIRQALFGIRFAVL